MSLSPGTALGPYKILALLGAGGMGEVYRAQDPRLGREVAIKVLPPSFAADPDRLSRFEQEARAAGSLNHPNILAVYDLGAHDRGPYLVTELLEGETLRDRLNRGKLPPAAALDIAAQIARGLAAAHAKGIVHRDLKPENLFVNRDGRVKILDFGLAKLVRGGLGAGVGTIPAGATMPAQLSESGQISGTAGYMAPEQVRGETVDVRTDIFALGTILHEMLSGSHPFQRSSVFDTLEAIVRDDPPALPAEVALKNPDLDSTLARALAKERDRRFQSAADLAFVLEMEARRAGGRASARGTAPEGRAGIGSDKARAEPSVSFQRLTYRRGYILNARFTPDASNIIYGAAWEGKRTEIFMSQTGSAESRALGITDTDLLSVSPSGELAVSLGHRFIGGFLMRGMLARTPPYGGAAREIEDGIMGAEWAAGGNDFIVVRDVEGKMRLEYPLGNVLHETAGWFSHVRASRDGRWIAFIDHPIRGDDRGAITVVSPQGEHRTLADDGWVSAQGLAWGPDGREVWFTATAQGAHRRMYAVTLDGSVRQVLQIPGSITLLDVSSKGDVLFTHGSERIGIKGRAPGESLERDLSWLDWSLVRDISSDGQWVLFDETGEGAGDTMGVFMRKMDGSPAVRLSDGVAMKFSPDRRLVLTLNPKDRCSVTLVPAGAGTSRRVSTGDLEMHYGMWHPDGKSLLLTAHAPGAGVRQYRLDLTDGKVTTLTPEGYGLLDGTVSPDGSRMAITGPDHAYLLQSTDGGEPRPISGIAPLDRPITWSQDGKGILTSRRGEIPALVDRIDVETGERTRVREILPVDSAGLLSLAPIRMTPDGEAYAYSYLLLLHDLYLARGLA